MGSAGLRLPASADWVHEWQSFWVEIWVSTPDTTTLAVAGATVNLQYYTGFTTAPEIVYGPAFTLNRTGSIDDNNQVDFGDLAMFAPAFGHTVGAPDSEPPYVWWADFDKSGRVDFGDLTFFAPNFGKTRSAVQAGTRVAAATHVSHLIETFRQPESPVTLHSQSDSSVAAPAEQSHRWSERCEPLEDLLSLLADQPSDRLPDPHDALFAQAGR